jgi:hypothetical protein
MAANSEQDYCHNHECTLHNLCECFARGQEHAIPPLIVLHIGPEGHLCRHFYPIPKLRGPELPKQVSPRVARIKGRNPNRPIKTGRPGQ